MLRILYTLCDALAALFAVISPVAIFHWLLLAVNNRLLNPFLVPLTQFFTPLNASVQFFIQPPVLHFSGQEISTTQGIVACVFTALFLGLSTLSEYFKTIEQRQDLEHQAELQRIRLKRLQALQETRQTKLVTNRRYLVQVNYDFNQCPAGGQFLDQGPARQAGKPVDRDLTNLTLEFLSLSQSLHYALTASQALMNYYATLRPKDPQPPFRIGVHATDRDLSPEVALQETQRLTSFAMANTIIFSQTVRDVLEADGQSLAYKFHSMGLYAMGGQEQELFRLFNAKPSSSF
ncbi:hypothetical protein EMOOHJMP_00005 [Microcystis phage MaAM05]|nr:hypothetical protein EMOOHJMP_00005 [Microcystis phage MaAM05]